MIGGLLKMQGWEQVAKQAEYNAGKMASLCSISERQLQRIFKRHLQCTPSRWLRDLQCRLAKDLIASGYTSKAAAAELKFASESHFCREFKKVFGHPPQSFAPNPVNTLLSLPSEHTVEPLPPMPPQPSSRKANSRRGATALNIQNTAANPRATLR